MKHYRTVVEFSPMRNNDEWVIHTEKEVTNLDQLKITRPGFRCFETPELVFSRPIHSAERGKLDTSYEGDRRFDEDAPEITRALDDFYKLKEDLKGKIQVIGLSPDKAITMSIGAAYYSCMSGGAGRYYLSACRYFIEQLHVSMDEEVYGQTVKDFLEEIKDVPRLEELIGQEKLPVLNLLLTE